MSLAPRARVGPYGIVALLGSGGMGEVYRARDAALQRALGIAPDTAYVVEKRPVYVTKDGIGKPALRLFA